MFPFSNLFTALSPESGQIFLICNLPSPSLSSTPPPPFSNSYHTQLTKGDCVAILSSFSLLCPTFSSDFFSIFTTTKLCATFSRQKLNTFFHFFFVNRNISSTPESAALNYVNYPFQSCRVLKWVAKFDKLRDAVCCTSFLFVSLFETRKV